MSGDALAVPPPSDERWRDVLQLIVDDPARLTLHAQPIVELTTGQVVGFELLSRFTGPWLASPDKWFSAADHWGVNVTLQSRVLSSGIAARALLPPDTFLTVNVDPHLLTQPEIAAVLTSVPDLSRLVLEITEHSQLVDEVAALEVLGKIRGAGALLALDDAGTGYAGLSKLLTLRPNIVKLDRELVTGVDVDPVKRALVEVFGDLAGQMDAWILAEGIETREELDVLIGLGVPLGQGYLLARPAPDMVDHIAADLEYYIRSTANRRARIGDAGSLWRTAVVGTDRDSVDVLLAPDGHAIEVRLGPSDDSGLRWAPAMIVAPDAALADVGRRAMARPEAYRFAPVVCTDGTGVVLGVIRIDELLVVMCD